MQGSTGSLGPRRFTDIGMPGNQRLVRVILLDDKSRSSYVKDILYLCDLLSATRPSGRQVALYHFRNAKLALTFMMLQCSASVSREAHQTKRLPRGRQGTELGSAT